MKQVIRIQHPDNGVGIFMNDIKSLRSMNLLELLQRHQMFNDPYMDGLNLHKDGKKYFCAYKTLEQLQEWIMTEEIGVLKKHGFRFLLLEVSDFQEGDFQIIFTKESITNMKDITDIFQDV